jgi:hypothetical protein
MQPLHKVPLVLAALAFALAAIAEIATGRSRLPQDDDAIEWTRRAALVTVDDALRRGDTTTALRAWQQAYEAARMTRGWRPLVEVADVRMRIGETTDVVAASPRARQAYFAALSRARAERSVDGVVRVAEGFARLGDRDVTEHVLRIAASLATRSHDSAASTRVETARGRLLARPSSLSTATF